MCGIAGWVDYARDLTRERDVLQKMTTTMKNRGPDDEGTWLAPRAALVRILGLVFKLGLGGRMGSGQQYWPWIALTDEVEAIVHLLGSDVSGGVNLTAPNPVTNAEFVRTLGRLLHRPTPLPVPGFALSLALGEFARSSILGGRRAVPEKLLVSGYAFSYPDLEPALRTALSRS